MAYPTVECILVIASFSRSSPKVDSCIIKVEFFAAYANYIIGLVSPE